MEGAEGSNLTIMRVCCAKAELQKQPASMSKAEGCMGWNKHKTIANLGGGRIGERGDSHLFHRVKRKISKTERPLRSGITLTNSLRKPADAAALTSRSFVPWNSS